MKYTICLSLLGIFISAIASEHIFAAKKSIADQTVGHTRYSYPLQVDTNNKKPPIPELFVPGAISAIAPRNAAPAFAPVAKMLYLGQSLASGDCMIMKSVFQKGGWSTLLPAAFSGQYRDIEPAFSPDGKYLIFASNRPAAQGDSVLAGHYNGQLLSAKGGNLWKVSFSHNEPGKPERLPDVINANSSVFSPAIVADGSLYFMRADSGGKFHIYRSQNVNGKYEKPVKASFSIDDIGDFDPVVAPDESFLIFSSSRSSAPQTTDLFIIFKRKAGWSTTVDLRAALGEKVFGVEARLSPDLRTLYYSNSLNASGTKDPTLQNIWRVDISRLLLENGIKLKR